DRYPMNTWLPREVEVPMTRKVSAGPGWTAQGCQFLNPLIPVKEFHKARVAGPYLEIDEATVEPEAIAAKMDEWFNKDITEMSLSGKDWAKANSWAVLKD